MGCRYPIAMKGHHAEADRRSYQALYEGHFEKEDVGADGDFLAPIAKECEKIAKWRPSLKLGSMQTSWREPADRRRLKPRWTFESGWKRTILPFRRMLPSLDPILELAV